jgi:hypothetical protein
MKTNGASIKLPKQFVVCVKNDGCDDLSLHTVYELLPDADAEEIQYLRIIDDSGEDYLYPALYFLPVDLSEPLQHLFLDVVQIGN